MIFPRLLKLAAGYKLEPVSPNSPSNSLLFLFNRTKQKSDCIHMPIVLGFLVLAVLLQMSKGLAHI